MTTYDKLLEKAMTEWRDKKGVGTAFICPPLNDKAFVLAILQRIYNKTPTLKTLICVNSFKDRIAIIEFLTKQEEEENNNEFKKLIANGSIQIFTSNYLNVDICKPKHLVILYCVPCINAGIEKQLSISKFKLAIINKLFVNKEDTIKLYKQCPLLNTFKNNEVSTIRSTSPVEDVHVGITIPNDSEEAKLLDYYNEYIATSVSIFGSLEAMNEARVGNKTLNISSAQVCAQIAQDNGWDEHLDMSSEFNIQLDELYNPGNLKDRASLTYDIIRKRGQLLANYEGKLEAIYNIVKQNSDKKILIINKYGDFANKVTEYINNMFNNIICGNYHDKMVSIPAIDFEGNPVYYKTGQHTGERKMMGIQAQKTHNMFMFNNNKLNILSASNAPDKELNIDIDILIITSPQCNTLKDYLYRLNYVNFTTKIYNIYNIYCRNSLEEKQLNNQPMNVNYHITNVSEKIEAVDENFDFIVAD